MLFKNVFRTLKKQYVQLVLLGVIIILSSLIYTSIEYGIAGVLEPTENYFEEANQEDFAISMIDIILEDDMSYLMNNCPVVSSLPQGSIPISLSGVKNLDSACYYGLLERRINVITSTYSDIDIEVRESKDVYFSNELDSFRIKFLKDSDTINKSFFVEGYAPSNDSEIAVAETFARNNDLKVGDSFTVSNKEYIISGFVLFPDYNLPLFGSDFILDNTTQTVGLLSDSEFERLSENVSFEIAGVFKGNMDEDRFETKIMDTYKDNDDLAFISSMLLTANNTRSGGIYADLAGGRAYGIMLSLLISTIALMIVGIMVSRVLHSQRGPIGILKSMGYTNNQITFPYILFITVLAFPTLLAGYFIGLYLATPFKDLFMSFYLLPSIDVVQTPLTIFVSIFVPLIFIVGLSFVIVKRLLDQKPVTLLNPEVTSNSNFITKRATKYLKRFKITSKLQHLLLYRNIAKFSVFLIGMFYAAFLILFSFSMNGMFDRMLNDYYDNTNHEYVGYCEYNVDCPATGDMEKVIEIPSILIDDEQASIVGLNPNTSLHPLFNEKGKEITSDLEDGLVITESLKILNHLKIGDNVLIEIGDKKINVEVVAITFEYSGEKAYINIAELSQSLTNTNDYYNAVYSKTELNKDDYILVINNKEIVEQAETMQEFFTTFVTIMMISSIVIGAIIIYILTVMTIEDNFYNISLFKVIGFNEKEINKMILGGYSLYGVIVFVITIPFALLSFIFMESYLADYYGMIMPLQFKWWHGILSVIVYLLIFNFGALTARRKLNKVALQEAMKMYQA